MSLTNTEFEDELADAESLVTLLESRKDMSGSHQNIADAAINHHITLLIYRDADINYSTTKYIRVLQPIIKARASMEKQKMNLSEIDHLIDVRLNELHDFRVREMEAY